MRLDFSLTRGGLAAVAAALGAGGVLLFFAGMLVGTASARPAEGDPAAAHRPAEPCAPAAADSAARAAGPAVAAPAAVLRDEARAPAMLERMSARGVPGVVEAEAAPDGKPVFRVRPAGGP